MQSGVLSSTGAKRFWCVEDAQKDCSQMMGKGRSFVLLFSVVSDTLLDTLLLFTYFFFNFRTKSILSIFHVASMAVDIYWTLTGGSPP